MADEYISSYSGAQIDEAVARALPDGAIDQLLSDKLSLSGGTISAPSTAPLEIYGDHSDGAITIQYANKTGLKGKIGFNSSGKPILTDANGNVYGILHTGNIGSALTVNGVTEWINPPMQLGVEYRTTERYLGKPVYAFAMDFGGLPNTASAYTAHNRGTNINVIAYGGTASNGNALPCTHSTANSSFNITLGADNTGFYLETFRDRSSLTATVWMKYTKTTD